MFLIPYQPISVHWGSEARTSFGWREAAAPKQVGTWACDWMTWVVKVGMWGCLGAGVHQQKHGTTTSHGGNRSLFSETQLCEMLFLADRVATLPQKVLRGTKWSQHSFRGYRWQILLPGSLPTLLEFDQRICLRWFASMIINGYTLILMALWNEDKLGCRRLMLGMAIWLVLVQRSAS